MVPRSYRQMKLKIPRIIPKAREHEIHHGDIFNIAPSIDADLAYYDPPWFEQRQDAALACATRLTITFGLDMPFR